MMNLQESCLDKLEAAAHRDLAAQLCNLRFDEAVPVVAECNTLSIVSPEAYFAQRLDCRTYFAQRQRYGHDRPEGVFHGPDDEQFAYCRELCERLGISHDEIARADVLREFGQAARIDPQSSQVVEMAPQRELRTFMHVERQAIGVPVWSSHLAFGLSAQREIGFLEVHWPDIPGAVVREAQRLTEMVCNGWRAPEQTVAAVESIQAGIVHTPAVGYFFDVHAAVRVIYRSLDPNIGRKPTYHLDRHGVPVRLRSTSALIRELPLPKRQPQSAMCGSPWSIDAGAIDVTFAEHTC
jgi:hypothetical protein